MYHHELQDNERRRGSYPEASRYQIAKSQSPSDAGREWFPCAPGCWGRPFIRCVEVRSLLPRQHPQLIVNYSGRSTPIPPDAPPSVQSISSARKQARAQAKHRKFYTINYTPRVSHFDPNSDYRDFRGFFVLFWISLAIMVLTTVLRNIRDTGYPLRVQVWSLLTANVWQLGLSDALMVLSTALSLPLQKAFHASKGALRWRKSGIVLQSMFQAAWLALWVK